MSSLSSKRIGEHLTARITYLLQHCDTDEEYATVEWVASHLADEFNLPGLLFSDGKFIQAA